MRLSASGKSKSEFSLSLFWYPVSPYISDNPLFSVFLSLSQMSTADVTYSCGSCGYPLNLNSSNRITSSIGSKYQKTIKKGVITFLSIDVSRFTQVDEVKCLPYSWGLYRMKTKLLCRNCGVLIGYGYSDSSALCGFNSPDSCDSTSLPTTHKKYTIKIKALQPSDQC